MVQATARYLRSLSLLFSAATNFQVLVFAVPFGRIRGYLSTLRKQGQPLLSALESLLQGQPLFPALGPLLNSYNKRVLSSKSAEEPETEFYNLHNRRTFTLFTKSLPLFHPHR